MNNVIRFDISQYFDGKLEISCNQMHYAFDERFNFDDIPKEKLFDSMAEIQEHCIAEGMSAKFIIL